MAARDPRRGRPGSSSTAEGDVYVKAAADRRAGPAPSRRPHLPNGRGFRGPFELMELVGIDVGSRWPNSLAELLVRRPRLAAGQIRRYVAAAVSAARPVAATRVRRRGSYRADDPEPTRAGGAVTARCDHVARSRRGRLARRAGGGYELREGRPPRRAEASTPTQARQHVPGGAALLASAPRAHRHARRGPASWVWLMAPLGSPGADSRTRTQASPPRSPELFSQPRVHAEWVGGRPRPRAGRIVCQLCRAAFAVAGASAPRTTRTWERSRPRSPARPVRMGRGDRIGALMAVLAALGRASRGALAAGSLLVRRCAIPDRPGYASCAAVCRPRPGANLLRLTSSRPPGDGRCAIRPGVLGGHERPTTHYGRAPLEDGPR